MWNERSLAIDIRNVYFIEVNILLSYSFSLTSFIDYHCRHHSGYKSSVEKYLDNFWLNKLSKSKY
jgi:hypothetical protein